jgi:hypothetical protein
MQVLKFLNNNNIITFEVIDANVSTCAGSSKLIATSVLSDFGDDESFVREFGPIKTKSHF